MTLSRLLAVTCILALAGCGKTESSPPAETPPAATTASSSTAATKATPPAKDEVLKSEPADKATVDHAEPGAVATSETVPHADTSEPLLVNAHERLTDQEVKALLESIEKKRAAFEAALDDKLKNSTIKAETGEVKTNQFFDDLQDQVKRARGRFSSTYSASSEVLSLLQFATRLDAWASTQPAGFRGSKEWGALATDFRRLSAAYNSALLRPGQQALGAKARRLNDAELVTAAANIDKNMDAFRHAYDSALAENTSLTPASRQAAIQNVDAMKHSAKALNDALGQKHKGVAEANALLKESAVMINATLKLPPSSTASAAWTPVRDELLKVALAYEATASR
jgi:predicted small lipoprotein YifL